jgi:hypothetical protein
MKYVKNLQIFNQSNFINENKVQIIEPEQLSAWKKPKQEEVNRVEKLLQSYNKVEFSDWEGNTHIITVKDFYIDVIDDTEDDGYRMDYLLMDSEGNYYHIDTYKPIFGL